MNNTIQDFFNHLPDWLTLDDVAQVYGDRFQIADQIGQATIPDPFFRKQEVIDDTEARLSRGELLPSQRPQYPLNPDEEQA